MSFSPPPAGGKKDGEDAEKKKIEEGGGEEEPPVVQKKKPLPKALLERPKKKGIIKEEYILNKINDSKNISDKFIQEVLWRTYWKGWLERHKEVWLDYKGSIELELDNN